MIIIADIVDRN